MKKLLFIVLIIIFNSSLFSQEYNCLINDEDFEGVKTAILNMPFENDRTKNGIEYVKRTKCCFTSAQIYQIAESFTFSANLSAFLKGVYDNIADDQSADFYKLLSLFNFDNDKNAFSTYIASHRSACSGYDFKHKQSGHHEKHDDFGHKDNNRNDDIHGYNCAISDEDFEGIKSAFKEMTFENNKSKNGIELIKRTNCCFTSHQIYELAESFNFEDNLLKFLKGSYDNILDDQSADFYKILSLFKFENNKTAFSSYISSHRSRCSDFEIKRHKKHEFDKHDEHKEHFKKEEETYHNDHNKNMNNDDINVDANFDETNTSISVGGQNGMPNTNISININVPNQPVIDNKIYVEWVEPLNKVVATENNIKKIKAKIYCKNAPAVALIIDKNIIAQEAEKFIQFDDKGYIITYNVNLHKGENHISLRVVNPLDNSYIYSEERIIDCEK